MVDERENKKSCAVGRTGGKFGATTLSLTTFSIMTFSITTFSIMTFSVMKLSIMTFSITINKSRHSA